MPVYGTDRVDRPDDKLHYAKNYIDQYFRENVDLSGLAGTLGFSYDYFRHQFKETTGYSPMKYIIRKRIDAAKKQLLQTDKPVTAVAMECGFANTPQFCMIFKKQVGETPNKFRKSG